MNLQLVCKKIIFIRPLLEFRNLMLLIDVLSSLYGQLKLRKERVKNFEY